MSFQTIQEFYDLGLWNAEQLQQLVVSGGLTAEQYQEITGQPYPAPATTKDPVSKGVVANG